MRGLKNSGVLWATELERQFAWTEYKVFVQLPPIRQGS